MEARTKREPIAISSAKRTNSSNNSRSRPCGFASAVRYLWRDSSILSIEGKGDKYIPQKGGKEMLDVRNSDGRLVCQIDEKTGDVEIKVRDCKTIIKYKPDSIPEIINTRT